MPAAVAGLIQVKQWRGGEYAGAAEQEATERRGRPEPLPMLLFFSSDFFALGVAASAV